MLTRGLSYFLEEQIDSVCLVLSQGQLGAANAGKVRRRGFNQTPHVFKDKAFNVECFALNNVRASASRPSIHNVSATVAFVLLIGHNSSWLVSRFR